MEPKNIIKDIYTFLDTVDSNENVNQEEKNHKTSKVLLKSVRTEQNEFPKIINNKKVDNKCNSWDSKKPIKAGYEGLKRDCNIQTKKETTNHNAPNNKEENRRLIAQKKEYEKAIKRHLSFIEKESLNKIKDNQMKLEKVNALQSEEIEKLKEAVRTYRTKEETLYETIRGEFAEKLAEAEKSVLNLTEENKHLINEKNKTLEDIHSRVKTLIAKKDDSIENLKAQYEAAVSRAEYFEDLLLEYKNKFGKMTKNSSRFEK